MDDRDFRLAAFEAADEAALLALNNDSVPNVNALPHGGLVALAALTPHFLVAWTTADILAGFVVALPPGCNYASLNYRWFGERFDDFLYVDRIIVAPDSRRRGLSALLYAAVEARVRDEGRQRICCEVNIEPPNPVSMAAHERLGFRRVGEQRTEGGSKRVAMLELPVAARAG